MRKLTLNLLKYRLEVKVSQNKRSEFAGLKLTDILKKFLEHKHFKRILGSNLALALIITTLLPSQTGAQLAGEEAAIISIKENPLETQKGFQYPPKEVKITQGFSFFHPGLDLDGVTGDPIRPAFPGKVEGVQYYKGSKNFPLGISYGNAIIIDHGNGRKSLYAHLSKILVKEDEEVNLDTIIGEMGSTGHSTGSHLHFEIRDNDRAINPLSLLKI